MKMFHGILYVVLQAKKDYNINVIYVIYVINVKDSGEHICWKV